MNCRLNCLTSMQCVKKGKSAIRSLRRTHSRLFALQRLRMWPAQAHTERVASGDDVIPLRFPVKTTDGQTINSIRVQKGQVSPPHVIFTLTHHNFFRQVFFIPAVAVNRDPAAWGEDGERFDPERWLDPTRLPTSDTTTSGFSGVYSFLEGPRMCIGYRLGTRSSTLIISFAHPFLYSVLRDQGRPVSTRQTVYLRRYGCQD